MSTLKALNTELSDLRGEYPKPRSGAVGIEIEAEGPHNGINPATSWELYQTSNAKKRPKYWNIKPDHSLRNGTEYVTRGPLPMDSLGEALEEWAEWTKDTVFRADSIRTSVHYHVNVSDLTLNQILAAIVGYWIIEAPLVDTQGPTRVGNLFCLRVSDADFLVTDLVNSIEKDHPPLLGPSLSDNVKYAALNLNTIRRFGSLEFRFNKGTTDPREIERWACFFYNMVHTFAGMQHPKHIIRFIEEKGAQEFFEKVAPPWLRKLAIKPGWVHSIESNYSYAFMVHSKLEDIERAESSTIPVVISRYHTFLADPDQGEELHDNAPFRLPEVIEYSPDEELVPLQKFMKEQPVRRPKSAFVLQQLQQLQATPPPNLAVPTWAPITFTTQQAQGAQGDTLVIDEDFNIAEEV